MGFLKNADWQKFNREVLAADPTKGLEDSYLFEDRDSVAAFLREKRLRNLLMEAVVVLNSTFGEAAIKTLKLDRDDEGIETLCCLVMVPGELQEAQRALQSFDERWWLAHCGQAVGRLNFDFELV